MLAIVELSLIRLMADFVFVVRGTVSHVGHISPLSMLLWTGHR